jgi:hypothetical protein
LWLISRPFLEAFSLSEARRKRKTIVGHPTRADVHGALRYITASFQNFTGQLCIFIEQNRGGSARAVRNSEQDANEAKRRIEEDLMSFPRVHLSTIGSSHKLPVEKEADEDDEDLAACLADEATRWAASKENCRDF